MAGRIPQAFIDDLIARADIAELIGSRVPLKKAGREFKACCPFHNEKTASFWVSPEKQFYHCFGCGAHGTALGFLMQYDQLPFPDAVEELAARLGLTVPHEGGSAPAPRDAGQAQYDLLARAADFFASALAGSERARRYAAARGLDATAIERFRIGYAPDSWNELLKRFGDSDEGRQALLAAGLIIERERADANASATTGASAGASGSTRAVSTPGLDRCYDRFRDRLMFPIRDTRGRVIAFGGRVIDRGEPKYLNSPETELFHKGQELYGLYETRQSRTPLKRLLVVEGYLDAVRLHQSGLPYAVATLGTATTVEHLRRAFRLVSEVTFAFDGDRAGRAAAWRALQNALPEAREGREIRFLFLPEGEDPDSLVGREGGAAFETRLGAAVPLSEYLLTQLLEQADVRHADGKARFIAALRPLLEKVPAGVYRELLLERVASALSLSAGRLQQLISSGGAAGNVTARTSAAAGAVPASGPGLPEHRARPPLARQLGRGGLITQAIALVLHFPAAARAVSPAARAALQRLPQPGLAVLRELLDEQRDHPAGSMAQTLERWRERPEYRRLTQLAAAETLVNEPAAAERELTDTVARLLDDSLRRGRLEELIIKAREQTLDDQEKLELQALIASQSKTAPPLPRAT